jgi:hypothetical protein
MNSGLMSSEYDHTCTLLINIFGGVRSEVKRLTGRPKRNIKRRGPAEELSHYQRGSYTKQLVVSSEINVVINVLIKKQ